MSEADFQSSSTGTQAKAEGRAPWNEFRDTIGKAFELGAEIFGPPRAATQHFRQARKELLMGFRELIDARITRISRDQEKGTRVVVD